MPDFAKSRKLVTSTKKLQLPVKREAGNRRGGEELMEGRNGEEEWR